MKTAVITGATGFIGSRLACKLLNRGWCVHNLGRAKDGTSFQSRSIDAIDDICGIKVNRELFQNLHTHEINICDPDFKLPQSVSEQLRGSDAILFHVAGDTKFNMFDSSSQHCINVTGSMNVIKNLHNSLKSVVHVSTAYVAGNRTGLVLENDLFKGQHFHNYYEKSKLDAEIAVTELCDKLELPLCITRPSIIINDSVTGRSPTLTHLNALVYVITRVQQHYGIKDGEAVGKRIRIPLSPDCRPNLAPVDPIVDSLIEIGTNKRSAGKTFHLCHPKPQTNAEIVSLIAEAFGVKDKLRFMYIDKLPKKLSWMEEMMMRTLKPYIPYVLNACTFDLTNTRSIIPDYDSRFSEITSDYLKKVIDYQRHRHINEDHR